MRWERLAENEHIIFSERYNSSQIVQQYANLLERYVSDKRFLYLRKYFLSTFLRNFFVQAFVV